MIMDETRAVWQFYLLEAAGPMEMAGDVLNLFLIKEKAPVCVRDELLERGPGRRSQREAPAQRGGGRDVLTSLTVPVPHPPACPQQELCSPSLLPALPSSSIWSLLLLFLLLRAPAPWGCSRVSAPVWWSGQAAPPPALSLLISKMDTKSW